MLDNTDHDDDENILKLGQMELELTEINDIKVLHVDNIYIACGRGFRWHGR